MKKPLYQVLARHILWQPPSHLVHQREQEIKRCMDLLPSGSGWDSGTTWDSHATCIKGTRSNRDIARLELYGSFHHMSEGGYDGWTQHQIQIYPSLAYGFRLHITGPNRNDIKTYLYEMFDEALRQEIDEYQAVKKEA